MPRVRKRLFECAFNRATARQSCDFFGYRITEKSGATPDDPQQQRTGMRQSHSLALSSGRYMCDPKVEKSSQKKNKPQKKKKRRAKERGLSWRRHYTKASSASFRARYIPTVSCAETSSLSVLTTLQRYPITQFFIPEFLAVSGCAVSSGCNIGVLFYLLNQFFTSLSKTTREKEIK